LGTGYRYSAFTAASGMPTWSTLSCHQVFAYSYQLFLSTRCQRITNL